MREREGQVGRNFFATRAPRVGEIIGALLNTWAEEVGGRAGGQQWQLFVPGAMNS